MKRIAKKIIAFFKSEEGASGIEYAIVAAMVAVVIVTFSTPIGTAVKATFMSICTGLGATCT